LSGDVRMGNLRWMRSWVAASLAPDMAKGQSMGLRAGGIRD
jgi:hypothetical protein